MSHKTASAAAYAFLAASLLATTGCVGGIEPQVSVGMWSLPVPVSPYFQQKREEKFWFHERYDRVPVLGPITADGPHVAMDPPSDDEVMRKLEAARPVEGGGPFLHTIQRNNVRIVKDPISDYVDPPRVVPLIGPAQLHHAHYKCTVYFTETQHEGWPLPHTNVDEECVEVVYIDHDHFHMVGNIDGGPSSEYQAAPPAP
ncbi:MAG: hypothetical protein ACYC35_06850 [Pirellulales bacterium]